MQKKADIKAGRDSGKGISAYM